MKPEEALYRAGIEMPDGFRFACNGHWIDVINSGFEHKEVRLHLVTPHDREIVAELSLKDVKDLIKELKAAKVLVSIAEDY